MNFSGGTKRIGQKTSGMWEKDFAQRSRNDGAGVRGVSRTWRKPRGLVAKDHSSKFIAEALGFIWVISVTETLGEFEELLLFSLFGLDAILDQFDQHAVRT